VKTDCCSAQGTQPATKSSHTCTWRQPGPAQNFPTYPSSSGRSCANVGLAAYAAVRWSRGASAAADDQALP
jgi:hypothetical protein